MAWIIAVQSETCNHELFSKILKQNYPRPHNKHDAQEVIGAVADLHKADLPEKEKAALFDLALCSSGEISPLAAALGGFVAQEALKAGSGKFTPLQQYFYLDALECLPKEYAELPESDFLPVNLSQLR